MAVGSPLAAFTATDDEITRTHVVLIAPLTEDNEGRREMLHLALPLAADFLSCLYLKASLPTYLPRSRF